MKRLLITVLLVLVSSPSNAQDSNELRRELFSQNYAQSAKKNPRMAFLHIAMLEEFTFSGTKVAPLEGKYQTLARSDDINDTIAYIRDLARDNGLGFFQMPVAGGAITLDTTPTVWRGMNALLSEASKEEVAREINSIANWPQERLQGLGRAVYNSKSDEALKDLDSMYSIALEFDPSLPDPTGSPQDYLEASDPLAAAVIRSLLPNHESATWEEMQQALASLDDAVTGSHLRPPEASLDEAVAISESEPTPDGVQEGLQPLIDYYEALRSEHLTEEVQPDPTPLVPDYRRDAESLSEMSKAMSTLSALAAAGGQEELSRGFAKMGSLFQIGANLSLMYASPDPITRINSGLNAVAGMASFLELAPASEGPAAEALILSILDNQRIMLESLSRIEVGLADVRTAIYEEAKAARLRHGQVVRHLSNISETLHEGFANLDIAITNLRLAAEAQVQQSPQEALSRLELVAKDDAVNINQELSTNSGLRLQVQNDFSDIVTFIINFLNQAPFVTPEDDGSESLTKVVSDPWRYEAMLRPIAISATSEIAKSAAERQRFCNNMSATESSKDDTILSSLEILSEEDNPLHNMKALSAWNYRLADALVRFHGTNINVATGAICNAAERNLRSWDEIFAAGIRAAYLLPEIVGEISAEWNNHLRQALSPPLPRPITEKKDLKNFSWLLGLDSATRKAALLCIVNVDDCTDERFDETSERRTDLISLMRLLSLLPPTDVGKDYLYILDRNDYAFTNIYKEVITCCYIVSKRLNAGWFPLHVQGPYDPRFILSRKKICIDFKPYTLPGDLGDILRLQGDSLHEAQQIWWGSHFYVQAPRLFEGDDKILLNGKLIPLPYEVEVTDVEIEGGQRAIDESIAQALSEDLEEKLEFLEDMFSSNVLSSRVLRSRIEKLEQYNKLAFTSIAHSQPGCLDNFDQGVARLMEEITFSQGGNLAELLKSGARSSDMRQISQAIEELEAAAIKNLQGRYFVDIPPPEAIDIVPADGLPNPAALLRRMMTIPVSTPGLATLDQAVSTIHPPIDPDDLPPMIPSNFSPSSLSVGVGVPVLGAPWIDDLGSSGVGRFSMESICTVSGSVEPLSCQFVIGGGFEESLATLAMAEKVLQEGESLQCKKVAESVSGEIIWSGLGVIFPK